MPGPIASVWPTALTVALAALALQPGGATSPTTAAGVVKKQPHLVRRGLTQGTKVTDDNYELTTNGLSQLELKLHPLFQPHSTAALIIPITSVPLLYFD